MSINMITGKPGSGKSYLAVQLMIEQYYNRLGEGLYEMRDPNILICTNIDGLKLPSLHLDKYFREKKITFDQFFTAAYQEKFTSEQGKKIVYFLDECQRQIGPYFKNQEVIYYFDTHRHYDHEIWLISQDRSKICKQVGLLSEFEYRAVSKTLSLTGEMKYNVLQNGEHAAKKVIRPKKELFKLYTSAVAHNQKVKKSRAIFYIPVFVVLFLFAGYIFYGKLFSYQDRQPNTVSATQILPVNHSRVSTPSMSSESPIDRDRYVWIEVSHIARPKTNGLYIYDYLTSQFIISKDYPFPFKLRGKIIFAYLPERVINAERQRSSDRAGSQASGRDLVGGQNDEIVTPAARYFQGLPKKAIDSTHKPKYISMRTSEDIQSRGLDGTRKKGIKAAIGTDTQGNNGISQKLLETIQYHNNGLSKLYSTKMD